MKGIEAVIFDVDGTLLDSMEIWEHLAQRYLASLGVNAEPGLQKVLEKMSTIQGTEYLIEHYGLQLEIDQAMAGINEMLHHFYSQEVQPKEGVIECLKLLNTKGIPVIVATSGERGNVEAAFDRLGIRSFFKGILTCSEMHTDKTKPDIYLEAARQMRARKETTLVVEDVGHTLETAKKAGFVTAGVYDFYSKEQQESIEKSADYYLHTLFELEKVL